MAIVKIQANWCMQWQKEFRLPPGYMLLKINPDYLNKAQGEFKNLARKQREKDKLLNIDVTIDIHYKARTLDQNALMWSLYTILANEQNAGKIGPDQVTSDDLYEDDLQEYAQKSEIEIDTELVNLIAMDWKIIDQYKSKNEGKTIIHVVKTTSKMNTVEMAQWLEMLFNRAAEHGVSESVDTHTYWIKWRQYLDKKNIILHNDDQITGKQYKAITPICEATGQYIGKGGSLAHIKARGRGGNAEAEKDQPSNWLHLNDSAHMEFDNGMGRDKFLKHYPHLKTKVEAALKIEYELTNTEQEIMKQYDGEVI